MRQERRANLWIARRIAEGEKLLQVGAIDAGELLQLAPRGIVEEFADANQAAGKRPASV